MDSPYRFSEFESSNSAKVKQVETFLNSIDLEISPDIELFVTAKEDQEMVACGGLAGKVLKCVAVAPKLRGQGFILKVMTQLLKAAYKRNRNELFLFSDPKNREFFEGCGFKFIDQSGNEAMLMENTRNLEKYKKHLRSLAQPGEKIGSIVMNANPFTLGHRYLVEQSAKKCDWLHLFVVKEDASVFKFQDRLSLIKAGLAHIKNVTIHEGSDYLISKATFPTYFIKDEGKINALHSELDLKVYKHHIAPSLGITHRFVGHEPYCVVTNEYNQQMKRVLTCKDETIAIEVIEIPRLESGEKAISASRVRALVDEGKMDEVKLLVPTSTYDFLESMPKSYMHS